MKRIIRVLLVLAVAGAAVVAAVHFYQQWAARRANAHVLRLSGNVEAHESLVSFKVSGRVAALPVQEGQMVKTGELLARLDNDDYRQQVAMDRATTRLREAQLRLALAGSRRQDIEAVQQSVREAEADVSQKARDYRRYDALYKKDELSAQARDHADTELVEAQAALRRAQALYNEAVEGTRKEQLAVDRATVAEAEQDQAMSRLRLSYATLLAPFAGVILVRQAELGEVVLPGTPIVTLGDLVHVWVRVYVPETELGRIRWGQEVPVRTDSFPGRTYRGHVSFISDEAEFTPKSVQTDQERVTLVYRVKVDVDNPRFELKPGMPADVYVPLP